MLLPPLKIGPASITVLGEPLQPTYISVPQGTTLFTATQTSASADITTWVSQHGASWYGFTGDEINLSSMRAFTASDIQINYYYEQAPPPTWVTSPLDQGTVPSTTPALVANVSDPTDPVVYYDFKVSTAPDGSGTVVDSGWLTVCPNGCNQTGALSSPQWQLPSGALIDGMTYYVSALDDIGTPWDPKAFGYVSPAACVPNGHPCITSFTIKQRLGAGGPSPTDTVGSTPGGTSTPSQGAPNPGTPLASLTVNMATGNLALSAGTHVMQAVSGAATATLNYNSTGSNSLSGGQHGLYGQYFADAGSPQHSPGALLGGRLDPAVNFQWSSNSPMGGMTTGSTFVSHWTGTMSVPASGTWVLGGLVGGGGMRVWTDCIPPTTGCSPTYDNWAGAQSTTTPSFETTAASAGQHQIEVDFWSPGPQPSVQLWAKNTSAPQGQPPSVIVPTSWLTPRFSGLPAGWQMSADTFSGSWIRIDDEGSQVVLESTTGRSHDAPPTRAASHPSRTSPTRPRRATTTS
jgi:hypothetical protein